MKGDRMSKYNEPWAVNSESSICDIRGTVIAGTTEYVLVLPNRRYADRIAACVNACQHLTDEQLGEVNAGKAKLMVAGFTTREISIPPISPFRPFVWITEMIKESEVGNPDPLETKGDGGEQPLGIIHEYKFRIGDRVRSRFSGFTGIIIGHMKSKSADHLVQWGDGSVGKWPADTLELVQPISPQQESPNSPPGVASFPPIESEAWSSAYVNELLKHPESNAAKDMVAALTTGIIPQFPCNQPCPDCHGTGEYRGLNEVRACPTCGGGK